MSKENLSMTPEASLEALIESWRKNADTHARYKDARDDPYDDVGYEHQLKAKMLRKCADELEAAIQSSGRTDGFEMGLRQGLWINHGCSIATLYGDDGEMQCNACHVDFKRDPLARICTQLFALGRLHAGKLAAPPAPATQE